MSWISDVKEELRRLKQSDADVKKFGYSVGTVFLLISLGGWYLRWPFFSLLACLSVGTMLLFFGFLSPRSIKTLHMLWMAIAFALGWIVSRVILVLLFFGVITLISLLGKLFGKKFLDIDFHSRSSSYWVIREKSKKINYEKLY